MFLTSPLLGTLSLSLVTPLSLAYSIVFGHVSMVSYVSVFSGCGPHLSQHTGALLLDVPDWCHLDRRRVCGRGHPRPPGGVGPHMGGHQEIPSCSVESQ